MITRRLATTTVTALIYRIQHKDTVEVTVTVAGKCDKAKAEKKLEKAYECKVLEVKEMHLCNKLYGMDESDFIYNAFELDEHTRKPITHVPQYETGKEEE